MVLPWTVAWATDGGACCSTVAAVDTTHTCEIGAKTLEPKNGNGCGCCRCSLVAVVVVALQLQVQLLLSLLLLILLVLFAFAIDVATAVNSFFRTARHYSWHHEAVFLNRLPLRRKRRVGTATAALLPRQNLTNPQMPRVRATFTPCACSGFVMNKQHMATT